MEQKLENKPFGNLIGGLIVPMFLSQEINKYKEKKMDAFIKIQGGNYEMETKSRYEVIAELEQKKRDCIIGKDSLNNILRNKEKELKDLNREIEDKEEEIKDFKDSMEQERTTFDELIKSIDASLNRFSEIGKKK